MFSGGDDKRIKVWDLKSSKTGIFEDIFRDNLFTVKEVEEFVGHKDGVTCIVFSGEILYSGSFDHSIRSWDLQEMMRRTVDRNMMLKEELWSRKLEAYCAVKFKGMKAKKKGKK